MVPTKSYRRPHVDERFLELRGRTVHSVVAACREAGRAFVTGADRGWGRRELAAWLLGDYAPCLPFVRPADVAVAAARGSVNAESLERVMLATRERLMEMLADRRAHWGRPGFAAHVVDGGLVVGVMDPDGCLGYAPMDRPDMRLVDRVTSLFIADFLTRQSDYERLEVCVECGTLAFDGVVEHADWCQDPPTVSGLFGCRRDQKTIVGF